MSPGFGQQPRFIVTIQPVGTYFNPPARMTIPNVDGLPPRAVTEMYSYDHDLATFVAIGSATVSADGSTITSDPGSGVIKAGWHSGGNPNLIGSAGSCQECSRCSGSNCVTDDGLTPRQASINDCKEQYCSSGNVATRNNDSEFPINSCQKCLNGSPAADPAKNAKRIQQGCCYLGEAVAINPIADLAKCPQRTSHPGYVPAFNGCGGSGITSSVPDNPMLAWHSTDLLYLALYGRSAGDFTTACNRHDICYDTCINPAGVSKANCDLIFGQAMDTICDRDYIGILASGYRNECLSFSATYEYVVSRIEPFYKSAQMTACDCCGK
jgi:hypothetical protein